MSPSWAKKGPKRWRYYVSQAALQGDKSKAGSVVRVPAAHVEALSRRPLANSLLAVPPRRLTFATRSIAS
jgi:hypothetical protein